MKTITLSNFTGDKLTAAAARRQAVYAADSEAYQEAIAARGTHQASLRQAIATALRGKEIFGIMAGIGRYGIALFSARPQAPVHQGIAQEEIIWATGNEGEHRVELYLGQQLRDDWTLISGYRNGKGEIDQILVGPQGVHALEIKNMTGVIHCDGDQWWRDKYDKYGNLVEEGLPIKDKGGRGPSRQLNEAADKLQLVLSKGLGVERVGRAVVLSHDNSRIGDMRNITVDHIAVVDGLELERLFRSANTRLDASGVERAVEAIWKDHGYYNRPRRTVECRDRS